MGEKRKGIYFCMGKNSGKFFKWYLREEKGEEMLRREILYERR